MLRREDLKVGMRVSYKELCNILDTYIILGNPIGENYSDLCGEIRYITDTLDSRSDDLVTNGCCCIYNDSMDRCGDISYDE